MPRQRLKEMILVTMTDVNSSVNRIRSNGLKLADHPKMDSTLPKTQSLVLLRPKSITN